MIVPQKKSEKTYENAVTRLEEIAAEMENPTLPLEESSKLFEEAVSLISFCNEKLKDVELKIQKINAEKDI